jgi:antirestriction protein
VTRPRIYVASLSDYNAGVLHGRWIDAAQPLEQIWAEVNAMLQASPTPGAEEWAIHDYDNFGPLGLGEYEELALVARAAAGIAEHGVAFALWAAHLGSSNWDADLDRFDDCYQGRFDDSEAFVDDLLDSVGIDIESLVPEHLAPYVHIDRLALARDLEGSGYMFIEAGDGVHVFAP